MKNLKAVSLTFLVCIMTLVFACQIFAKGWVTDGSDWYYQDEQGENVTDSIEISNGKKYYLGSDGKMVRDYLLEDYNDAVYYFNDDGEMVLNTWVAVDPLQVSDPITNGPTIYLYYFGASGKAYKAKIDITKKTIDGKKYLFDSQGRMLSGWIDEAGQMYNNIDYEDDPFVGFVYYAGDETDGVLREGWFSYEDGSIDDKYYEKETIWFYFNPSSNKKTYNSDGSDYFTKKINGKTYSFDDNGVMLTAWEAEEATRSKYFLSDETKQDEYGSLAKKRWVFAVPSDYTNIEDYQDETYRWFYSENSGDLAKNKIRKIGTQYYAFDKVGIMKTGLVIFSKNGSYVDTIDMEGTDGQDLLVKRTYVSKDSQETKTFTPGEQFIYYFDNDETGNTFGVRKTGIQKVSMADKDWDFYSEKSTGEGETYKKKRFYQSGFVLKADPILGLGIVLDGYTSTVDGTSKTRDALVTGGSCGKDGNEFYVSYTMNDYNASTGYPHFVVIDGKGAKYTRSNTYKKDKEGNYWILGAGGTFVKAVTVPVKYSSGKWQYKSEKADSTSLGRVKSMWIDFGVSDASGCTVKLDRNSGDYEITPDQLYCVNFEWLS